MEPWFIELKNLWILHDSDNVSLSNTEMSKTEHEIFKSIYDFVLYFVEKSINLNYFNEKEIKTQFNIEFRSYFNYYNNIIKLYRPYPIDEDILYMKLNASKYEEVLTWVLWLVEEEKKALFYKYLNRMCWLFIEYDIKTLSQDEWMAEYLILPIYTNLQLIF